MFGYNVWAEVLLQKENEEPSPGLTVGCNLQKIKVLHSNRVQDESV